MPRSWTGIRDWRLSTNSYGLGQNCYYCTIAALADTDVETLISRTEIMQQDTANADEIAALFGAAGYTVQYQVFNSGAAAEAFIGTFPDRSALALGYTRGDGTGHMVVIASDGARVRIVDYQMRPPGVYYNLSHEAGIIACTVFYMP